MESGGKTRRNTWREKQFLRAIHTKWVYPVCPGASIYVCTYVQCFSTCTGVSVPTLKYGNNMCCHFRSHETVKWSEQELVQSTVAALLQERFTCLFWGNPPPIPPVSESTCLFPSPAGASHRLIPRRVYINHGKKKSPKRVESSHRSWSRFSAIVHGTTEGLWNNSSIPTAKHERIWRRFASFLRPSHHLWSCSNIQTRTFVPIAFPLDEFIMKIQGLLWLWISCDSVRRMGDTLLCFVKWATS